MQPPIPKPIDKETAGERSRAMELGRRAALEGKPYNSNPFRDAGLRLAWSQGHNAARVQRILLPERLERIRIEREMDNEAVQATRDKYGHDVNLGEHEEDIKEAAKAAWMRYMAIDDQSIEVARASGAGEDDIADMISQRDDWPSNTHLYPDAKHFEDCAKAALDLLISRGWRKN